MLSNKYLKISFISLVCLICIFLVSKELLNFDRIYYYELWGYSHLDNSFDKVCNFDKKFITYDLTNNVTPTREDSLFFTLPSKLFYNILNPQVTHRVVAILSYSIFVISLCILVLLLTKSYLITFLILSYTALWSQFLSYYFEFKLALTSLGLTSFTLLFIYLFHQALKRKKRSSYIYTFLLPFILLNLGFEAFCISRPLSIVIYIFIFSYLLIYHKKHLFVFILSTIFSICLLKYMYPSIKFDLSIFIARGESFVEITEEKASLLNSSEIFKAIPDRMKETLFLFKRPKDNYFISEMPEDTGFLDIFVCLLIFIIPCFYFLYKKDGSEFEKIKKDIFFELLILMVIIFSFITPFFSTTYLRGHRFLNFYYASIILLAILTSISLTNVFKKFPRITKSIIFILSLSIFYYKINNCINSDFKDNIHMESQECLQSINKLTNEAKNISKVNKIFICDKANSPLYEPSWNGILFISGIACKRTDINNEFRIYNKNNNEPCNCEEEENNICIIRDDSCNLTLKSF